MRHPGKLGIFLLFVAVVVIVVASTQKNTDSSKSKLKLTVVGNNAQCSLKNGLLKSFSFKVTGATPGDQIMILPFYPKGVRDPVYLNPAGYYWFQLKFGIYTVPASGTVSEQPWNCRTGPTGEHDPPGRYAVYVVVLDKLPKTYFTVTK